MEMEMDESEESLTRSQDLDEAEEGEEVTTSFSDAGDTVLLPRSFFDLSSLSAVLNLSSWESLDERERQALRALLPPGLDESSGGFLDKLLSGDAVDLSGSPSLNFFRDILAGLHHPKVVRMRSILTDLDFSIFFHDLRVHHNTMVDGLKKQSVD